MEKPIIILGAGGHAKVLIEILNLQGRKIIGNVVPKGEENNPILGVNTIGADEAIFKYKPHDIELVNGVGSLPGNSVRWDLDKTFSKAGYTFATLVHPSAVIASNVTFEEGVQVMAGSVIQPGITVGRATIINTRCSLDHDCKVGKYCHIAPGVTMSGEVTVGNLVHIGTGSSLIQSIKISNNVVVGAGSTIFHDIEADKNLIQVRDERIKKINSEKPGS